MKAEAPWLGCPECGGEVFQAQYRGRYDRDGNFIEHGAGCRCRWCNWMWFDDEECKCECGARLRVLCDDGKAYATAVCNPAKEV